MYTRAETRHAWRPGRWWWTRPCLGEQQLHHKQQHYHEMSTWQRARLRDMQSRPLKGIWRNPGCLLRFHRGCNHHPILRLIRHTHTGTNSHNKLHSLRGIWFHPSHHHNKLRSPGGNRVHPSLIQLIILSREEIMLPRCSSWGRACCKNLPNVSNSGDALDPVPWLTDVGLLSSLVVLVLSSCLHSRVFSNPCFRQ